MEDAPARTEVDHCITAAETAAAREDLVTRLGLERIDRNAFESIFVNVFWLVMFVDELHTLFLGEPFPSFRSPL